LLPATAANDTYSPAFESNLKEMKEGLLLKKLSSSGSWRQYWFRFIPEKLQLVYFANKEVSFFRGFPFGRFDECTAELFVRSFHYHLLTTILPSPSHHHLLITTLFSSLGCDQRTCSSSSTDRLHQR
jgi:hypothetical protein